MDKIVDGVAGGYQKIEGGAVDGYKKIESGVVGGCQKMEDGVVDAFTKMTNAIMDHYNNREGKVIEKISDKVVGGFNKISDRFVDSFLAKEGESVEDAKVRLAQEQADRDADQKARMQEKETNMQEFMAFENNSFHYTYSAPEQQEVKRIREKYISKEESKLDQLRRLDESATKKGMALSLVAGTISALILGVGMCCCMVWGEWFFLPGIVIGLVGIIGIIMAYPVYTRVTRKEREKSRLKSCV